VIDNPTGTGKMLINSQTGEVIKDYGVDPVTGKALAPANDLKKDALISAQQLLDKFNAKQGTSIVGTSRLWTFGHAIPGTAAADFQVQFDNLKGKISLDNVKYLKGQGQVSDAERKLLAEASSKLNLSQSEAEFKKSIEDIIMSLSGGQSTNTINVIAPDGTIGTIPASQLQDALNQGYKKQ
jgi:hypothetical protein